MLTLKWLGQAGYLLSDGETTVCIDPYLSDVVNRVASRPRTYPAPIAPEDLKCDVMICSHDHLDHIDIDAIPLMDKTNMTFFAPSTAKEKLESLGVKEPRAFDPGDRFAWGKFKFEGVFADHTAPTTGIVVTYGDTRLYFTSDTLYDPRLEDVKCDILFICINGKLGNMDVEEAIRVTEAISPVTAVPNHYDMFASNAEDPTKFTSRIPNGKILTVNQEYKVENKCLI